MIWICAEILKIDRIFNLHHYSYTWGGFLKINLVATCWWGFWRIFHPNNFGTWRKSLKKILTSKKLGMRTQEWDRKPLKKNGKSLIFMTSHADFLSDFLHVPILPHQRVATQIFILTVFENRKQKARKKIIFIFLESQEKIRLIYIHCSHQYLQATKDRI